MSPEACRLSRRIPTETRQASIGARLAALAAGQHGVVTRRQLSALGLDDGAIGRRVRTKRLHRIQRGVYAEGHPRLTLHGRFLAAVMACGDGAVLSHLSAAVLWALRPERGRGST